VFGSPLQAVLAGLRTVQVKVHVAVRRIAVAGEVAVPVHVDVEGVGERRAVEKVGFIQSVLRLDGSDARACVQVQGVGSGVVEVGEFGNCVIGVGGDGEIERGSPVPGK